VLTGVVGFSVWLHHMFTVGMSDLTMSFFSAGSMMISLFTTITIFAWLATVWKGRPVATTSMLFALGSVALLVIGGLSGVVTGIIPVDWQLHNTYYVIAHIHYVLIGANVFPVFAGLYFWGPKMTGRMMNEKLGKWSFWVMFVGFNLGFFPMHIVGIMGMPRRIYTYAANLGLQPMNELMTFGAFLLGVGILMSIVNLLYSLKHGAVAGNNPWYSDGLEWAMSSPPPDYEVVHIPAVATRHPLWDTFDEDEDPGDLRVLSQARLSITSTLLDAVPQAAATMPDVSIVPMFLALALFVFFLALVFQLMWVSLTSLILTFLLGCMWLCPRPIKGSL
jgi:heme/copper-type cytochrome/quinol oxidase subunit 1